MTPANRPLGATGRRALFVSLVAFLVTVALPQGQATAVKPASTSTAALRVTPTLASTSQVLTFAGRVPAQHRRVVLLERRTKQGWRAVKRGKTSARGAFKLRVKAGSSTTFYRVRAPKVRVKGITYRARTTSTRTVRVQESAGLRSVAPSPSGDKAVAPTPAPLTPAPGNLATSAIASTAVAGAGPERTLAVLGAAQVGWRASSEAVGAWIELGLDRSSVVRRLIVERDPEAKALVESGYLTFDDGSMLQVRLDPSAAETVVAFAPRQARSVRFTVTGLADGATTSGLRSLRLEGVPDGARDVVTSAESDGDAAPSAHVTASVGNAAALTDGNNGQNWSAVNAAGGWVRLDWSSPRELTSLVVGGATSAARLKKATLEFSDGTSLFVGGVLNDSSRPTVVSFMPRVASWVRLRIDETTSTGELKLSEISTLQPGAKALSATGGTAPPIADRSVDCSSTRRPSDSTGLVVLCPTSGDRVGDTAALKLALGPSYTSVAVKAWSADGKATTTTTTVSSDDRGIAEPTISLTGLPNGPVVLRLVASSTSATAKTVYFGLRRDRSGASVSVAPELPNPARGRSLVWAEEFDRSLSFSKTTSLGDYFAAKPEYWGPGEFGSAIWGNPENEEHKFGNVRQDDGLLRLSVAPNPPGFNDPNGWGRTRTGGIIASGRPGGSGFAAQYGYFEARMMLPAGAGTWPAFWMLPTDNLVSKQDIVAEIDAMEHYGNNPLGVCHTTHSWGNPVKQGQADCNFRRWATDQEALSWHTFGVSVEPTRIRYFVDGVQVASAPQVGGGDDPMFWMLDLALGGGYPVGLGSTQDRAELYVDWVRVWV